MPIKNVSNPGSSEEAEQLSINCWAGCWIHASWAGCWGKGKLASVQLELLARQLEEQGVPREAFEGLIGSASREDESSN